MKNKDFLRIFLIIFIVVINIVLVFLLIRNVSQHISGIKNGETSVSSSATENEDELRTDNENIEKKSLSIIKYANKMEIAKIVIGVIMNIIAIILLISTKNKAT